MVSGSTNDVVLTGDLNHKPVLLGVGLALGFLVGAGLTAILIVSRCRPKNDKDGKMTSMEKNYTYCWMDA